MDFKPVYAQAMHDQAPKMLNRLARAGEFQAHLQEKSREAHALLRQLAGNQDPESLPSFERQMLERQVLEQMLEFPDESPEPQDPLGRNQPKSPPAE